MICAVRKFSDTKARANQESAYDIMGLGHLSPCKKWKMRNASYGDVVDD